MFDSHLLHIHTEDILSPQNELMINGDKEVRVKNMWMNVTSNGKHAKRICYGEAQQMCAACLFVFMFVILGK